MAMLAEPRRKQKVINLRAKNNAWSNDSSKFGQRMLEKMGWTSGKGLGANENGITEHVIARYKNDDKGLGFEDKNDQWTKHEDDFNALLANLSNANDGTENLHSGISLEDKSKKSKARIHYHKFTRGKDISRYSEKDLANIFGKKSFKSIEQPQVPLKDDLKPTEQIFTEKGSMEDYFKVKLAEFKSKSKSKTPIVNENDTEYEEPSYGFHGFSQENDVVEISKDIDCNQDSNSNNVASDLENFKNKKKKSKKHKVDTFLKINEESNNTPVQEHINENHDADGKVKKKKLKNKVHLIDNKDEITCEIPEYPETKIKKIKTKNKITDNNADKPSLVSIDNVCETDENINREKKLKNDMDDEFSLYSQFNGMSNDKGKNKKNPKNKEFCEDIFVSNDIIKKKKSKRKTDLNIEDVTQNDSNLANLPKKKKKKCKI